MTPRSATNITATPSDVYISFPSCSWSSAEAAASEPLHTVGMASRASGSNHLNCGVDRVDPLKLDAGCGCCKAPVGLGVFGISPAQPGRHLLLQSLRVGDAPVEALRTQNSQLRPRLPFETLDQAARLGGWKCFVE